MMELSENKKVIGKDNLNCDNCWADTKVFIVEVEKDIRKNLCHKCFHAWRIENKLLPESQIPAYNLLLNALDLLQNSERLETLIGNLSEEESEVLYTHPLLDHYDLLP